MIKPKWYQTAGIIVVFLLFVISALAAGFGLTSLIFSESGRPPGIVDHVVSGLIGIIVMIVISILIQHTVHRQAGEDRFGSYGRQKQYLDVLDALSRITRGDFKVFLAADNERGPFSELAASVNKMAKELGSLENLRQDFISNVSHEIQSPLTSISGYAALLKRDGISGDQINHYATIIETESKRLSKLSDNLLRLSALDADCSPLEIKSFRLDKQLENILLMLEPQWSEKNIMPDVVLPAMMIKGNEDLLSQVWINLLHNAIKFTPDRGIIRVVLTSDKENVICSISDSGIGIAPEDQTHIFERFYKVDKSRDRSLGGNGLGLSLVKKIVELHGGDAVVKSRIGQGTEFIVSLPNQNTNQNAESAREKK